MEDKQSAYTIFFAEDGSITDAKLNGSYLAKITWNPLVPDFATKAYTERISLCISAMEGLSNEEVEDMVLKMKYLKSVNQWPEATRFQVENWMSDSKVNLHD